MRRLRGQTGIGRIADRFGGVQGARVAWRLPLVAIAVLLLPGPTAPPAHAEPVAVARPVVRGPDSERAAGTAFFLAAPTGSGVAGVAAAHSVDPAALADAEAVEFRRGTRPAAVTVSTRVLAPPGLPLSAPGGTVRDDFVVFALERPPDGLHILQPDVRLPKPETRVRILGVPAHGDREQVELGGEVISATPERIEVKLDDIADLRGFGGAPVLHDRTARVVGMLQAARPQDGTYVLAIAPIEAVTRVLDDPLDDGEGRAFASFPATARRPAPTPSAAPDRSAAAAPPPRSSGSIPRPPPGASLLGETRPEPGGLQLTVEEPVDGSVTGDANGAFVAGRALALAGDLKKFDVVIVLDTSGSTAEPSGGDVNGNGVVGKGAFGGLFGVMSSDPGDSILAAEVAAARQLLEGLDPRTTRVALVTFAGEPPVQGNIFAPTPTPPALTEEPLTTDYERIHQALTRVLQRGPYGNTHMAAGADQATVELRGFRGALSQPDPASEKIVLFLTDGQPTLPYPMAGFESRNVMAVLRAADRASRAGVRVHSFAIGPEALAGPVAAVELAARTGGYFTPVRNPADLVQIVEQVRFSNVEEVAVQNLSTGAEAEQSQLHADGSWSALVPLQAGKNRIRVEARASDGATASEVVTVSYAPGAPAPVLPRELVAKRNRLLEQKLVELRRETKSVQIEAAERTRKQLAIEIEQERAKAAERAERQRKELQLEVETPEEL